MGEWAKGRNGGWARWRVGLSGSGHAAGEATNGTNETYGTYVGIPLALYLPGHAYRCWTAPSDLSFVICHLS
jgi:hypothetical protein